MKIRTKLLIGFLIVAIISGVIGYVGITKITEVDSNDTKLYEMVTSPLGDLNHVVYDFQQCRVLYRDMVRENNPAAIAQLIDKRKEISKGMTDLLSNFEKSMITEEGKKAVTEFYNIRKDFTTELEIVEKLALENQDSLAIESIDRGALNKTTQDYETALMSLVENKINVGKAIADENTIIATAASKLMLILLILAAVFGITLGFIIAGNIQNIIKSVIKQTKDLVEAAVGGKLATRAKPEETNEEFREIVIGINKTLDAVIGPLNVAAEY
ncbi:MAG: MCP four helix bundle domain-containing protein, partial [Bacteroidales bacterium]|nr:MCP four helix bundle domain-containing protein [Bacteroidales bacterium]